MLKYKILLTLFLVSLVASSMLAFKPIGNTCNIEGSCNAVQASKQAQTFGIKNYYYGISIFLFLSFLTVSEIKKPKKIKRLIINLGVILGFIISLYFIYLMLFEIKSTCQYCLAVDASMILAFLTLIYYNRKKRRWIQR